MNTELNEAAEKYANENMQHSLSFSKVKNDFKAGAQWQAEQKQDRACPCLYLDEPCHDSCTCKNKLSSYGCLYCCTYGSIEQRKQKAQEIQRIFNLYYSEQKQVPTDEEIEKLVTNLTYRGFLNDAITFTEAVKRIKSALQYSVGDGWIDVKDAPKNNDDVLVIADNRIYISFYAPSLKAWGGKNLPVTHWQPLPSPPINK